MARIRTAPDPVSPPGDRGVHELDEVLEHRIRLLAQKARYDAVRMIDAAQSGHIGGSLSSMDIFSVLWGCAQADDRIVISHGHTAPGVYAVLGNLGAFDLEEANQGFRRGTRFEGHPSRQVPGVEWGSGSLGQGLSVGCGLALAKKIRREGGLVYVVMGDGEQAKGQLQEAREFAVKFRLDNLIAVVDVNGLQASGRVDDIMPQRIQEKYQAAGWVVESPDGHDVRALHGALRRTDRPKVVLARTIMSKGVPWIENQSAYHGKLLTRPECENALRGLRLTEGQKREWEEDPLVLHPVRSGAHLPALAAGIPRTYGPDVQMDCRSAFGAALADVAARNTGVPMAVLDCDLMESLKLAALQTARPDALVECGIAEQNAVTMGAAMAGDGVLTIMAAFSVFALAEAYGQHRMADLNHAPLRIFATHAGLDTGEDGKSHQCLDYIALVANLYGYRLILPADANQADRVTREALITPEATAVVMGRSRLPVLCGAEGQPRFGDGYHFKYGQSDWLRRGHDACIITFGTMAYRALQVAVLLEERGLGIAVLNVSCPLCLDTAKLQEAVQTGCILTYEDHNIQTGLGSIIGTWLAEQGRACRFVRKGVTRYGGSDTPDRLYQAQALDPQAVAESLNEAIRACV